MNGTAHRPLNGLPHDDEVESRARAIFRDACASVDSCHVQRLGLARRKALDVGTTRSPARAWAPLAGAAACCALVVAGVAWMQTAPHAPPSPIVASSAPITASPSGSDNPTPDVGTSQMEIVQNLDFYRWLASQPSVASVPAGSGSE